MPVILDIGSNTTSSLGSAGTGLAANFTIGAGLRNQAIVGCLIVGGAITSPAMTWGGVSMPLINLTSISSSTGSIALFGLTNPGGGTKQLSASWTGSFVSAMGMWSFWGVDQTGGNTTFPNGGTTSISGAGGYHQISTTANSATVHGWASTSFGFNIGGQNPILDWQQNTQSPYGFGHHLISPAITDTYTYATTSGATGSGCGCQVLWDTTTTGLIAPAGWAEVEWR